MRIEIMRHQKNYKRKEAAEQKGERFFGDRRWAANTDEEAAAYAEGRPRTVRLKMPVKVNVIQDLSVEKSDLNGRKNKIPLFNDQTEASLILPVC